MNEGDPVSTWPDSSSNHNDATQSGAARPTFKASATDINNKPAVNFNSTASAFLNLTKPFASNPITYFVLMSYPTGPVSMASFGSSVVDAAFGPLLYQDNTIYLGVFGNIFSFGSWAGSTGAAIFTGSTDAATFVTMWRNGVAFTTGGNLAGTDGAINVIGRRQNNYGDGYIAAMGAYNVALDNTTRSGIEKYLSNKYAIPVAGGIAIDPLTVGGQLGWWEADTLLAAPPIIRSATDSPAISEAVLQTIHGTIPRTASEALAITQSAQATVLRLVTRTASELVTTAEVMQRSKVANRTAADALSALVVAARTLATGRITTETLAVAEAAAKSYILTRGATDSLHISELAFKLMELTMYVGAITDSNLVGIKTDSGLMVQHTDTTE